jgi:hypothetical protein
MSRRGFSFCLLFSIALFLGSCASRPRPAVEEGRGEFDALAPGAQVYFYVDVSRSRSILDMVTLNGISGKNASNILGRTSSAVGAVYPPGGDRRFLLESQGNYPRGRGRLSMAFSSAWKKTRSPLGKSYYHSQNYGLSVVLERNQALLSDQDPYAGEGGVRPPKKLDELRKDAILAGWMETPGPPVNRFLSGLGIPIPVPADRLQFGVYEAEIPQGSPPREGGRRYTAVVRVETPSESQARALGALVSMARMVMGGARPADGGGLMTLAIALFANPPVLDGKDLIVRTGELGEAEIALLFSRFSVYSD